MRCIHGRSHADGGTGAATNAGHLSGSVLKNLEQNTTTVAVGNPFKKILKKYFKMMKPSSNFNPNGNISWIDDYS